MRTTILAAMFLVLSGAALLAQETPRGTENVEPLSNVELPGPQFSHTDIVIEQEVARPYAYIGRILGEYGFDIIDISDPSNARELLNWRIEDPELHLGLGGMDPDYFKLNDRYYFVQSFQFFPGGPNADLCAIVFDVTGLPDVSTVREVGRIRDPDNPAGCHNIFAYKHSSGRVLLFTTSTKPVIMTYDMERFLAGDEDQGLLGETPWPSTHPLRSPYGDLSGYHDMHGQWDPNTEQDKLYGAGLDGYYVFDISTPEEPELIASVVGAAGVDLAHQVSPTPDGRYLVSQTEYLYSPVRIFDIGPALDGEAQTISEEIGVWTGNWKGFSHNHEVRWPYVFVAHFEEGFWVFEISDPTDPKTIGHFDTYTGPERQGLDPRTLQQGTTGFNGAWGVDVRNEDGLVVVSDFTTGFWTFHVEGFDGWHGEQFGVPNLSSAQDWDVGPTEGGH